MTFQRHIKVFAASKNSHAQKFIQMRLDYPDIHFTASWPDLHGVASVKDRPTYHWMSQAQIELINSDAVLVHAEPGEILKTALLFCGIAWDRNIPIFTTGDHASYAEWQFNDQIVLRSHSVKEAINKIRVHFRGEPQKMGKGNFGGMK